MQDGPLSFFLPRPAVIHPAAGLVASTGHTGLFSPDVANVWTIPPVGGIIDDMGNAVKPENYRVCICGRTCAGQLALRNHGRVCEMEQERSRLFIAFAHDGKHLSDAVFLAAWRRSGRPS